MYNEETKAPLIKIADEYARLAERAKQRLNEPTSRAFADRPFQNGRLDIGKEG
jgi:hypothetical protein